MPSILVFVLFFAGVYFLLLRPQQQRVRRQRELITAIGVGDRVVTAGGLIGRVVDVNDDRLLLEVADGVVVELLRLAISRRLDDAESASGFGITSRDDNLEEIYAEEAFGEEGEPSDDGDGEVDAGDDDGDGEGAGDDGATLDDEAAPDEAAVDDEAWADDDEDEDEPDEEPEPPLATGDADPEPDAIRGAPAPRQDPS